MSEVKDKYFTSKRDEHRLYYTTAGITNCNSEKKRVRKDIKDYDSTKE